MEIGPFRVKDENTLVANQGAWNKDANLLFVDQPIGVGLSTADTDSYIHELPEMAADMLTFLDNYFKIFPEQQQHEIYIAGESYAGQYIPYLADAINARNRNLTNNPQLKEQGIQAIDLKGVLIGNGWIDPVEQYLSYVPFAYSTGLVKQGSSVAASIEVRQRECLKALADMPSVSINVEKCDAILDTLLQEMFLATNLPKTDSNACVNIYDIRLKDTFSSCGMNWPEDLAQVTPYLRRPEVLAALNIDQEEQVRWKECSGPVGQAFKAKNSPPANTIIPRILEAGVQVLMFNGDQDLICNHLGNTKLIAALKWGPGAGEARPAKSAPVKELGGFKDSEVEESWYVGGEAAGTYQSGRNLTYVKVFNASHMVPFDVPEVSRTLLNQFIGIPGYSKKEQSPEEKLPEESGDNSEGNASEGNASDKDIEEATWKAYYRAGGVALVVVVILTAGLVIFVWRNRRLMHRAMLLNDSRPRGVHYEDGSPGDSIDGFDDGMDRPAGFVNSLFAGLSRWNQPHSRQHPHRRSTSYGNNKYYYAGGGNDSAGLMDAAMGGGAAGSAVQLTTMDKRRTSLGSLEDESDEESHIVGVSSMASATGSRPYSDLDLEAGEGSVPELIIERPEII